MHSVDRAENDATLTTFAKSCRSCIVHDNAQRSVKTVRFANVHDSASVCFCTWSELTVYVFGIVKVMEGPTGDKFNNSDHVTTWPTTCVDRAQHTAWSLCRHRAIEIRLPLCELCRPYALCKIYASVRCCFDALRQKMWQFLPLLLIYFWLMFVVIKSL